MAVPIIIKLVTAWLFGAALVTFALAITAPAALAEDTPGGGSPQDSTVSGGGGGGGQGGLADTSAVGEGETAEGEGVGRRGGRVTEDWWEVHPSYTLKINKRKDVTNWDSNIILGKQLSPKLSFNVNGTVVARENTTLNRSDSNNGTTAMIRYKMNDNIAFSMNYNNTLTAYRYDLGRNAPADRRKSQDVTVNSELTKRVFDSVDLNLRAGAGSTANSFQGVSNDGRRMDLVASVAYSPSEKMRTSTTFTGKRLFLDSRVDSGGAAVFTSNDNTFSENLAFSLSYEMAPGVRIGMDASNNEDQRQHPDPMAKLQETEKKSSKSASVSSTFDRYKRITWDAAVRFNSSDNRYAIRSSSNNKSKGADLTASAKILPWRSANLNIGGERDITRDIYTTSDTGNTLHKSLSLKLTQGLGPKANASLSAISDLTSEDYDNKQANPKDLDRMSNRVSVDASYQPLGNVATRFGSEFSEERSSYVKSAESANNRTTTKYRVYGSYDLTTRYSVGVTQTYDVGAVYTIYRYSDDNNSLVRNSNVTTSFRLPVTPALALSLDHTYKFQDQGSYRDVGGGRYGLSAASRSNTLALGVRYTIFRAFHISLRQSYYVQTNWVYRSGKKQLDYESKSTDLSGQATYKHKFGDKTDLSLRVEHNRSEGDRVSAAFKRYWNIELEASHAF